ncbi:hypothetical protein K432DRAFT_5483 [Lepidopterella palustris CBS 459.81]|uniref:Uncharacterized protein n=1 Tax=Lepidopterella palustris CBS 459.81 TaxID=1314670 RepID=A0A8E2DWY2_9PEZI|nr:hypothetical protein K432DRAFT_5483 [Lepidopterella palustris CBS 459.81]
MRSSRSYISRRTSSPASWLVRKQPPKVVWDPSSSTTLACNVRRMSMRRLLPKRETHFSRVLVHVHRTVSICRLRPPCLRSIYELGAPTSLGAFGPPSPARIGFGTIPTGPYIVANSKRSRQSNPARIEVGTALRNPPISTTMHRAKAFIWGCGYR